MSDPDDVTEETRLDVFCSQQGDAFRAYFRPGWVPRYLRQHLDEEGEAYPAHLDFEDLSRHMRESSAELALERSRLGGVRLKAQGSSAEALAVWLAGVFGTAIRGRPSSADEEEPPRG